MSDPKKRERYDRFGDDGDDGDEFNGQEWLDAYEYYRAMHPEITKQDVKSFAERYRNSKEEEEDLLEFYDEHDGDISNILEHIICSSNADKDRFVAFFEAQIKLGTIGKTKKFETSKKKIKLLPDEKEEAKVEKKKIKEE